MQRPQISRSQWKRAGWSSLSSRTTALASGYITYFQWHFFLNDTFHIGTHCVFFTERRFRNSLWTFHNQQASDFWGSDINLNIWIQRRGLCHLYVYKVLSKILCTLDATALMENLSCLGLIWRLWDQISVCLLYDYLFILPTWLL